MISPTARYTAGVEKIFWARMTQTTFFASYLLSLLDAPKHGQAVPHLRPSEFYVALREGRPYVKRTVKRKETRHQPGENFVFANESDALPEPPVADHADDQFSEDSVPMYNGGGAGDSSSSSSKSPKSSTKNASLVHSSASSVKGSDGGDGGDSDVAAPVTEVPLLMPSCTQYWRGFKFTAVHPEGWEVTCCCASHRVVGRCRRTYRFSKHGGAVTIENLLKHKCLSSHLCDTRDDHRVTPDPPVETLPTLVEMEAQVWPPPLASD